MPLCCFRRSENRTVRDVVGERYMVLVNFLVVWSFMDKEHEVSNRYSIQNQVTRLLQCCTEYDSYEPVYAAVTCL